MLADCASERASRRMRLEGCRSSAPPRGRRDKNRSPPCQFKRIRPIRRVLRRTWRRRIKGGSDMAKSSPPARKSPPKSSPAAKRAKKAKPRAKGVKQAPEAPHPVSPLAPKSFVRLPPLAGVRLATGAAGVRYKDRTDVLLAVLAPDTQVAGVFTTSKTASAPVEWCREMAKAGTARALVVNSGNA